VLEDGALAREPLRGAAAEDVIDLRGSHLEVYEPTFTFHGFRYVEIEGWQGELRAEHLQAVVLHTDMRRTGWFSCSDPELDRFHDNVVWSMRGNFVGVPTDCPQRDERLGWTGDLQVFAPTAAYLYGSTGMIRSWLRDLALEQQELGAPPHYVPYVELGLPPNGVAAWSDAAVVVPWTIYQRTGDDEVLREQYSSMRDWVDTMVDRADSDLVWRVGFQFGDWLDPTAPPDQPDAARTQKELVATAYFARSALLTARSAEVLGYDADARELHGLAASVRTAFRNEFVGPEGRMSSDAETAYVLALRFELLEEPEQRRMAGRRLAELVEEAGHTIRTGFVGTPEIADALSETGHLDVAYRLLLQRDCPSWLYPVTMGATTIWERWDSMLPDGSVNPGEMTSFNHYALGAVADWLHRVVAGLAPAAPGYRRLRIAPRPGGGLTSASAAHETPFGRAEVAWTLEGDHFELVVTVPTGTTAEVDLPGGAGQHIVTSGQHTFACALSAPAAA